LKRGDYKMSDLGNKVVFAKNLNYYLNISGKERKQVCEDLNIKYSTFSEWVNANKYPRIDKIEALANYFGIMKSDLIEDRAKSINENIVPYNPIVHKIPILGRIAAGLPLYAEEHIEGYTYTERNGGAEYFALRVKGDSMNAAQINDGSMIIVRRQPEVENGEIAVVRVNKEDVTVKRFKKDGNIVQLIPQSYNPNHDIQIYDLKNTEVDVIGKVVECKVEF